MRSRFQLIQIFLLLAVSVCHAFDPFIPPDINYGDLPGTWTAKFGNVRNTIAFNTNGTFSGTTYQGDKIINLYEGKWDFKTPYMGPSELIWQYSKSSTVAVGTIDRDVIEILNKKLLVIWTKNKLRHAYYRVPPATK